MKELKLDQVYDECIKMHALRWLESYQDLNTIEYLELHGGPIIHFFMVTKGLMNVIAELEKKLSELLK